MSCQKKKKTDKKDGRRSDVDILLWTIFYTTVGLQFYTGVELAKCRLSDEKPLFNIKSLM